MKNIFPLNTVSPIPPRRYQTGIAGFDRLLGGGLVEGSAILISGTPGSGKSTLLMQIAYQLAAGENMKVLYVNGEENRAQVKMRAERLQIDSEKILLTEDTEVESVLRARKNLQPKLIIIDSMQMLWSKHLKQAPATPTQMRYGLLTLTAMAKATGTIVIFVGHSTKGGFIAGLQTLQHMVDVTLYLGVDEIDSNHRFLKANKNRFGATDFVWDMKMTQIGFSDESGIVTEPLIESQTATSTRQVTLTDTQIEDMIRDRPFWGFLVRTSMDFLRKQVN